MRATVPGLAARRSIRAHVARISSFHGMSGFKRRWNSPVPHMAKRLPRVSPRAFSKRICIALQRDQRGCAGRMCRWEQRRRQCADVRKENRFAAPEIVEYRGDAVAHCSRVGACPA